MASMPFIPNKVLLRVGHLPLLVRGDFGWVAL